MTDPLGDFALHCREKIEVLETENTLLEKQRDMLAAALRLLRHDDGCFCNATFAPPGVYVRHTTVCVAACVALAALKNDESKSAPPPVKQVPFRPSPGDKYPDWDDE